MYVSRMFTRTAFTATISLPHTRDNTIRMTGKVLLRSSHPCLLNSYHQHPITNNRTTLLFILFVIQPTLIAILAGSTQRPKMLTKVLVPLLLYVLSTNITHHKSAATVHQIASLGLDKPDITSRTLTN